MRLVLCLCIYTEKERDSFRKNGQLVTAKSGFSPRFSGPRVGLSSVLEKGREAVGGWAGKAEE